MKISYNRPSVYRCEGVLLRPGVNVIPDEKVAAFMASPGVQARIRTNQITVLESAPAIKPVTETDDIAALREAAAGDKRKAATKAAIARLIELGHDA